MFPQEKEYKLLLPKNAHGSPNFDKAACTISIENQLWTSIDSDRLIRSTKTIRALFFFFFLISKSVVGAPQMTLQQYLTTLPCLPLPSGNLQTPFPSIPWCYLPISSSVFLSFLLFSLSPAELYSPCPRILRCGHTIWVSFSLPWLGDHHTNILLHKLPWYPLVQSAARRISNQAVREFEY